MQTVVFLNTKNDLKREFKKIPFTVASKRIKYLRMKLTKELKTCKKL